MPNELLHFSLFNACWVHNVFMHNCTTIALRLFAHVLGSQCPRVCFVGHITSQGLQTKMAATMIIFKEINGKYLDKILIF